MPRPAMLAVTCCFAPHLLSHAAPRHGRGHVIASRDHWRRVTHWPDRDRGIVYSRDAGKSRGAKRRCFPRSCSATNLDPFVESYVTGVVVHRVCWVNRLVSIEASSRQQQARSQASFRIVRVFCATRWRRSSTLLSLLRASSRPRTLFRVSDTFFYILAHFFPFFFCKTRISRIR